MANDKDLSQWTGESVGLELAQVAGLAACTVEERKKKADAVVAAAALAAATIGAAPIPFSDCALLVPTQLIMLERITDAFGMRDAGISYTDITARVVAQGMMTLMGRAIVANLIKLIPGAGSVIGGAISGATAAALTAALGEAYIAMLVKVIKGEISPTASAFLEELIAIFLEFLKIKRGANGLRKCIV